MKQLVSHRGNHRRARVCAGAALVFVLALSAEGDVATHFSQTASAPAPARAGAGFLYSRWIENRGAYIPIGGAGSDSLALDKPGSFWRDVADDVRGRTARRLRASLLGLLAAPAGSAHLRGIGAQVEGGEWMEIHRRRLRAEIDNAALAFYADTEHAFADALSRAAAHLDFVRRARVDFRTSLGGRKGSGGVEAAGALREARDDVVGWQLRAFVGEDSSKGGNAGLFYRRVIKEAHLAGANAFLDYEDGEHGDFWRWSLGGELKSRLGELSINRYVPISDAVTRGGKKAYTRGGFDADVGVNIPQAEWAKLRLGYSLWEGEFGDADIEGVRGGVDLHPRAGVVVGLEFDGESGDFGGNIAYSHTFGAPPASARNAGAFDPRAHFFDSVRREYSQRISRTEDAGRDSAVITGSGLAVVLRGAAKFNVTQTANIGEVTIEANSITTNQFEFQLTGNVTVSTGAGAGALTMRQKGGGWHLTLSANSQAAFLNTARVLNINTGNGAFERIGADPLRTVVMGGDVVTLRLLGTRFRFSVPPTPGAANKISVALIEGAISVAAAVSNTVTINVAQRASVELVSDIGTTMVVGCGTGVTRAGGANALCVTAGGNLAPILTPSDITLVDNRVWVPFGARVTVARFAVSMVAPEVLLTASVESPAGFALAAMTAGGVVSYDLVLGDAADVAGEKRPRIIIMDESEFANTITADFTVRVADRLSVLVMPPRGRMVTITQNITTSAGDLPSVAGIGGLPAYALALRGGFAANFALLESGGINNTRQINISSGVQDLIVEAMDALGTQSSITISVTMLPTPPLRIIAPQADSTAVAATTTIGVEATRIMATGGVEPLIYEFQSGANWVTAAGLPSGVNGAGRITVDADGRLWVQAETAEQEFNLMLRVRDSATQNRQTQTRAIKVSLAEGLILQLNELAGGADVTTYTPRRLLGTVSGQSQADITGYEVISGGGLVERRGITDNGAQKAEIYYRGNAPNTQTTRISIVVRDNSGGDPTPDRATASFELRVVNPPDVEAGLSGGVNVRYFVVEPTTILTVTASGGAGAYQFRAAGGSGAQMRASGSLGILTYRAPGTAHQTFTVYANDTHNNTPEVAAHTLTLSALARLRAENIGRPLITTGATLQGANANVVTVSISGGEGESFTYSRVDAGNQLTNALINNSGVINAADNTRIDAEEVNNSKAGSRNFVYRVVDGAIEARRQTLLATQVFNSRVPPNVRASHAGFAGNNVVTIGNAATVKWRIDTSGGYTVTNYSFEQVHPGDIIAASYEQSDNGAQVTVLLRATAPGSVSVSVVVGDQHIDTEAATVAREFIAINPMTLGYAADADFTPQTVNAAITFASVTIGGGLNPRNPRLDGQSGANNGDLYMNNGALIVRNNNNRNESERAEPIVFTVVADADNGDSATLVGMVEVVAALRLNGGGEYIVTVGAQGITIATIRAVGGERGDGYQFTDPSIAAPFAALEIDDANDLRVVKLGDTAIPASRNGQTDSLVFSVTDDATPQASYETTLTTRYVNPINAAHTFKDGGGALTTAAGSQIIGTIAGSGGFGEFTYTEINNTPLNVNSDGEIAGTFAQPATATISVRVDDRRSGEQVAATHPVTVEVIVTVLNEITIEPLLITLTTGVQLPAAGTPSPYYITAYGGQPPLRYSGDTGVSPLVKLGNASENRLRWGGIRTRNNPGTHDSDGVFVRDASTPERSKRFPISIIYVLPPQVRANTQLRTRAAQTGTSVTVAALTYSGGAADGMLTASLSVTEGNASIENNNEVVWQAEEGGAATVFIFAYQSDNDTAPQSTATVTANFVAPQSITLLGANTTPLTSRHNITIGTVTLAGGDGNHRYPPSFHGARGNFSFESNSVLILGGNNGDERTVSVTLVGNDGSNINEPVTLAVTVEVVDRVQLRGGGRITVFADGGTQDGLEVAVLEVVGGVTPYQAIQNINDNQNTLNSTPFRAIFPAGGVRLIYTRIRTAAEGDSFSFAYSVQDAFPNIASATIDITVIASLNAAIDFAGGALTTGIAATVATISASGGAGGYAFSANNNAVSFVEGTIAVANFAGAATANVDLIADDDNAAITEPITIGITLTALAPLTANINQTVNRYKNEASVAVAALTYSGGSGAAGLTATVAGVEAGVTALITNNIVVVSASAGVTGGKEITIAAYDSGNNTAPSAMTVVTVHFVAPLGFDNLPSAPLTVTTQDSQGSAVETGKALPIQIDGSGGNTGNRVYTPPANYAYTGGLLRYSGNAFPASPSTADVEIIVADTPAVDGYAQTATATVTVAFIDPPSLTIGFDGAFNSTPLTQAASEGAIIIGTVVLGAGLNPNDPTIAGSGGDFALGNLSDLGAGTVQLMLGGNNATDREATVTLTGNDGHSNTDAALMTIVVTVVDRIKLNGGGRFTLFAGAASSDPVAVLTAVGGSGERTYGLETSPLPGYVTSAGGGGEPITLTYIDTHADATAGAEATIAATVKDTNHTVSATVEVTIIAALSAGYDWESGALTTGVAATVATISAAGGVGDYAFSANNAGVSFETGGGNTYVVANIAAAGVANVNLIANDGANTPITEPITLPITLTTRAALEITPLAITVTTGDTVPAAGTDSGLDITASGGDGTYSYTYSGGGGGPLQKAGSDGDGNTQLNWTGAKLRDGEGTDTAAVMMVSDSSTPPRTASETLTVVYVLPPSVTVEVDNQLQRYKNGVSVTVASLSYSGGTEQQLTASLWGVENGAGEIANGNEVVVSVTAGNTGETEITVIGYESGNSTSPQATIIISVHFVAPLSFGNLPSAPLMVTTYGAQPAAVTDGTALPIEITGVGGNGTYRYEGTPAIYRDAGTPAILPQFNHSAAGLLRQGQGNTFNTAAVTARVELIVNDAAENSYAQTATATVTVAFVDPPAVDVNFAGAFDLTPLISGDDITIGTVAASGGNGSYGALALIDNTGNAFSLEGGTVLVLGGNNNSTRSVTVGITGDDTHANTDAATLSVAVTVVAQLLYNGAGEYVVTVGASSFAVATVRALGGQKPDGGYAYTDPTAPSPLSIEADNANDRRILSVGDTAVAANLNGERHTVLFTVTDGSTPAVTAVASVTVRYVNAVSANINAKAGGGAVTTGESSQILATIAGAGGVGNYSYTRISGNTVAFNINADNAIVGTFSEVGTLELKVEVDDALSGGGAVANTKPHTANIRITVLSPLAMGGSALGTTTLTTRLARTGVFGGFAASGGQPPYTYFTGSDLGAAMVDFDAADTDVNLGGFLRIFKPTGSESAVVNYNGNAPAITGMVVLEGVGVRDSSSPPRVLARAELATLVLVHPPSVTLGISDGRQRYKTGVSVDVGRVNLNGGSGDSGLRASVWTVQSGNGEVVGNSVVVSVTATGDKAITIIGYDSAHADSPPATVAQTVNFVAPLVIGGVPSRALTVTTQTSRENTAAPSRDLPLEMPPGGGNSSNDYTYSALSPGGFNFIYGAGLLIFNGANYPDNPATITATVAAQDQAAAQGYAQSATAFLTVAFVDPPDLTIGFDGAINNTPLTQAADDGAIVIGTVVLGGGIGAKDPSLLAGGHHADFRLVDINDADDGTVILQLAGDNTGARTVTATLSGNDDHSNTDAKTLAVTVEVVDQVKWIGGGRVTMLSEAAAEIDAFEATLSVSGGKAPYTINAIDFPAERPYVSVSAEASFVSFQRNADNTATVAQSTEYKYEVIDALNVSATVSLTVTVVAPVSAALDFAGGALTTGSAATVATISASGGAGDYTFSANNAALSFVEGTIAVANFNSSGTVNVDLIADDEDGADITKPATVGITVTALAPLVITPLAITVTTGETTPDAGTDSGLDITASGGDGAYSYAYSGGGGGGSSEPMTITTRVELNLVLPGSFFAPGFNGKVRTQASLVITAVPGRPVTVNNRNIGQQLQVAANRNGEILETNNETNHPIGNTRQIPVGANTYTLTPYPALPGGGGGGPLQKADGAGNAQLNWSGNTLRDAPGTDESNMITVTDSSTPPRTAAIPLRVVYVLPPAVAVDNVNQTVSRHKNEVSVTIASPTFSGGGDGAVLAARVLGAESGVTAAANNNDIVVSASAGVTGDKEITIAGYDSANNTAPAAMTVLSVHFVNPLGFDNLPSAPLTVTTQDSQGSAVEAGRALPIQIDGSGGNTGNRVYTPPANYTYTGGLLRYDGSTFPANPSTADVEIIVADTPAVDGYAQTATATVTVAFIDPPDLTIGFDGAINNAPLTAAAGSSIVIGTVVLGGGIGAKDPSLLAGSHADFRTVDINDADDGTVILQLTGDNTGARTVTATLSGDDEHSNTDAATLAVTVEVVDQVKWSGGGRVTMISEPAAEVNSFEATLSVSGGKAPYTINAIDFPAERPYVSVSVYASFVSFQRNAGDSATAAQSTEYKYEVIDALNVSATVSLTVTVVAPVSVSVNHAQSGNDNLAGFVVVGQSLTLGTLSAEGGIGGYVFAEAHGGIDIESGSVIVADFSAAETATIEFTADDRENGEEVPLTRAATTSITVVALTPVSAAAINITMTTGANPGSGAAHTITASGGSGSGYSYLIQQGGNPANSTPADIAGDFQGNDPRVLRFNGDNIILFANRAARITAGSQQSEALIIVRDSSTPPREYAVSITVHYVTPPALTVDVMPVTRRHKTFVEITAAELSYSGGAGGGNTATVLGVSGGSVGVRGDNVVMSAAVAAEVRATLNAYDADNASVPNTAFFVTVEFVEPISIDNLPAAPLTVLTRVSPTPPRGLPRTMAPGGGNGGTYNLSAMPDGFQYGNNNLSRTPEAEPVLLTATLVVSDNAVDGYSQAATATITVEYVHPPDIAVGFDGAPIGSALTVGESESVTVGTVTVGGGYQAQNPQIMDDANSDFNLVSNSIVVLAGDNTQARSVTATITADDNHTATEPASLVVAMTITAAPSDGGSSEPRTLTTRVEFPYEVAGALGLPGFNGKLRTSVSIVITVAPGANVTVNRALGTELNNIQGNRRAYIIETDSAAPAFAIGAGIDMDLTPRAYTLTPYPAISSGGGGGGVASRTLTTRVELPITLAGNVFAPQFIGRVRTQSSLVITVVPGQPVTVNNRNIGQQLQAAANRNAEIIETNNETSHAVGVTRQIPLGATNTYILTPYPALAGGTGGLSQKAVGANNARLNWSKLQHFLARAASQPRRVEIQRQHKTAPG